MDPSFKVYAPWRDPVLLDEFPGRTQMLSFLQKLLGDVDGSSFVKSKLEQVIRRCQATNPQQRPTANEVVQELLRVQQLIT